MYFLDASALAKAYLDEDGSTNIQAVMFRERGALFVSDFAALEVLTTLRTVFRDARRPVYQAALERFEADFPSRFSVVDVNGAIRRSAMDLTTWHRTARARAMDVLHLATVLYLRAARRTEEFTMVTSDRDLEALCKACGCGRSIPAASRWRRSRRGAADCRHRSRACPPITTQSLTPAFTC